MVVLADSVSYVDDVYSELGMVSVPCSGAVAVSVEWSPVCVLSLVVETENESVVGLKVLVFNEDSVIVISLGLLGGKVDDS